MPARHPAKFVASLRPFHSTQMVDLIFAINACLEPSSGLLHLSVNDVSQINVEVSFCKADDDLSRPEVHREAQVFILVTHKFHIRSTTIELCNVMDSQMQ